MPSDEERSERGFTIVDKRGRDAEPETEAEPRPAAPQLPKADFAGLALSLATSALFHLGLVAEPGSEEPGEKNLPLARHSIDTLELLEQKTKGNLTPEETELLTKLLTELRVHYVEASRS